MKIILNCEPANVQAATDIAISETNAFAKYDKVGWGWVFGRSPSFFVRRLKDGLSITEQNHPSDNREG